MRRVRCAGVLLNLPPDGFGLSFIALAPKGLAQVGANFWVWQAAVGLFEQLQRVGYFALLQVNPAEAIENRRVIRCKFQRQLHIALRFSKAGWVLDMP